MRLLVVRHAIAVPHGTPGVADQDRPLTPEGEAKFQEAARGLARIVDAPDALLTSPWLRARQTAAIAAEAWDGPQPKLTPALASGSFDEQARVLDEFPKDATVAIFGHEPWVSELVARLVGTRASDRLTFKKGGAALVEVPGRLAEGGSLVFYLPPKLLRKLA
jgi:phosphohistidine phosphatase